MNLPRGSRAGSTTDVPHGRKAGRVRVLLTRCARRWPTWLAVALVVITFADGTAPFELLAALLVVMPLCYLAFGARRRELGTQRALAVQLAGLVVFAAVGLSALAVGPPGAGYVVAVGWFAHGVWDAVHHRTGKVVPQAWSEWCGVVDILGAAAIVLLA
ncbi:hypothetical protein ACFV2Q_04385 [Streptomyces sp. NPDC059650]|uniref:hypothetical protein n=1 Tax=Streptomyces sp. NPDC059650 TaxID=3346896 RepID=UPI0036BC66F9